jgi:hypothetical protein
LIGPQAAVSLPCFKKIGRRRLPRLNMSLSMPTVWQFHGLGQYKPTAGRKKTKLCSWQGDQIGRIFAAWAIGFFGHLFLEKF